MIVENKIIKIYNLPEGFHCKLCTISNQRPRISFDKTEFARLAISQNLENIRLEKKKKCLKSCVTNTEKIMVNLTF